MEIGAYRGEHRLFLIFAASPRGEGFVLQDSLLAGNGEGFVERDLLRGYFLEDGAGSFDEAPVASEEASLVRGRFGVEPGRFSALLVGKDGTVKYRFDEPVGPVEVYALIDAMPLRQREMREGGRRLTTAR